MRSFISSLIGTRRTLRFGRGRPDCHQPCASGDWRQAVRLTAKGIGHNSFPRRRDLLLCLVYIIEASRRTGLGPFDQTDPVVGISRFPPKCVKMGENIDKGEEGRGNIAGCNENTAIVDLFIRHPNGPQAMAREDRSKTIGSYVQIQTEIGSTTPMCRTGLWVHIV